MINDVAYYYYPPLAREYFKSNDSVLILPKIINRSISNFYSNLFESHDHFENEKFKSKDIYVRKDLKLKVAHNLFNDNKSWSLILCDNKSRFVELILLDENTHTINLQSIDTGISSIVILAGKCNRKVRECLLGHVNNCTIRDDEFFGILRSSKEFISDEYHYDYTRIEAKQESFCTLQ